MTEYYGEEGYIQLMRDVLEKGTPQTDRTGVGTISVFDAKVIYLEDNFGCFSTIRPASLRLAFEEFWFFLRGETNTKKLEEKGVMFWKEQTSREFLDKRGLSYLEVGSLGAAYSSQFRHAGRWCRSHNEVDQLRQLLDTLKTEPTSRRLMIDLWNAVEHEDMPLTPCWFNCQVVVIGDYLHMKLRNRSLDLVFGYSFAVQQYRLFQLCLCEMFGYKLGKLSADLSHVHIYNNQIKYAKELVERDLGTQGTVVITKNLKTLDDLLSLQWDDIQTVYLEVNKKEFKTPKPPMAV